MIAAGFRLATLAALASALAACSGGPKGLEGAPPPPVQTATAETDAVFKLLMAGRNGDAAKRLKAIRKRDPLNPSAALLNDSIRRDPIELLGPVNYPYVVQAGDTVAGLAAKLLGNRLKGYQLLRYNGLSAPAVLTPGQVLKIPGEAPRAEPVRPREPAPRPVPVPAAKAKTPRPRAAASPAPNRGAAAQARAAGLAALNQGNIARAVGMLRRASMLDPGNPAIVRDLARAQRIAATVRARK